MVVKSPISGGRFASPLRSSADGRAFNDHCPSTHGHPFSVMPGLCGASVLRCSGGTFSKANRLTATLFRAKAFENVPPSHLRPALPCHFERSRVISSARTFQPLASNRLTFKSLHNPGWKVPRKNRAPSRLGFVNFLHSIIYKTGAGRWRVASSNKFTPKECKACFKRIECHISYPHKDTSFHFGWTLANRPANIGVSICRFVMH